MRAGWLFLSFVRASRCTRVARVDYITAATVLVRCSCLTFLHYAHLLLQKIGNFNEHLRQEKYGLLS
jgi:hypothetical protein